MQAQLRHLLDVMSSPHITLQVIPFGAGAHAGMTGAFVVMDFADPMDTDLIYIDSMAGDLFLESDADISRYNSIFDNLRAVALSPDASGTQIVGMDDIDLSQAVWCTSSRSSGNGQCVEVALVGDSIVMRDSKNPAGPVLVVGRGEWDASSVVSTTSGSPAGKPDTTELARTTCGGLRHRLGR